MKTRIIVGPEAMFIDRNGIRSVDVALTKSDKPADVLEKARTLWPDIRAQVSFSVWERHRLAMARYRRTAAAIQADMPGPYFPGPRPDLIAVKPWKDAKHGEWTIAPHAVVAMLIRKGNPA